MRGRHLRHCLGGGEGFQRQAHAGVERRPHDRARECEALVVQQRVDGDGRQAGLRQSSGRHIQVVPHGVAAVTAVHHRVQRRGAVDGHLELVAADAALAIKLVARHDGELVGLASIRYGNTVADDDAVHA